MNGSMLNKVNYYDNNLYKTVILNVWKLDGWLGVRLINLNIFILVILISSIANLIHYSFIRIY